MFVAHQHPFKIVTRQSESHPSFWIAQFIPPKPMKVSVQTGFMDDFGNFTATDFTQLAITIRE